LFKDLVTGRNDADGSRAWLAWVVVVVVEKIVVVLLREELVLNVKARQELARGEHIVAFLTGKLVEPRLFCVLHVQELDETPFACLAAHGDGLYLLLAEMGQLLQRIILLW